MARIHVHIGLPKTATTTLQQDLFPYINNAKYEYIGIRQPRTEQQDSLFLAIYAAIDTGKDIPSVKSLLQKKLDENKSLIISEEMLVVSNREYSWQQKLKNLSDILQGSDYRILVTVREPVSAMFSYYIEHYQHNPQIGQNWEYLALHHNDFLIYHYDRLLEVLDGLFFPERLYVQTFENIGKGDISTVLDFLDNPELEKGFTGLGKHNDRKSTEKFVIVPQKNSAPWLRLIYQALGGEKNPLLHPLKSLFHKKLSHRNVAIAKPTSEQKQKMHTALHDSARKLQQRFAVDYRHD